MPTWHWRRVGCLWACLLNGIVAATSIPAHALDKHVDLSKIGHQSFTISRSGFGATAMTRSTDGRLFLGNSAGLFIFDGLSTNKATSPSEKPLQSTSIQTLCLDPGGNLWVGFEQGGVSRASNRQYENYAPGKDLVQGKAWSLHCSANGDVWVATHGGVAQWREGGWTRIGEHSLPEGPATGVHAARDGSIWVVTRNILYFRPRVDSAFELVGLLGASPGGFSPIAETSDGSLWVGTTHGLFQVQRQAGEQPKLRPFLDEPVTALLVDRDDVLWLGGKGLRRFTVPGRLSSLQELPVSDDLSNKQIDSIAEDHNGSIWVATPRGIHRFSQLTFVEADAAFQFDGSKVLLAGNGNDLWVSDREHGRVLQYSDGQLRATRPVPSPEIGHRGADGSIWFAGSAGVSRFQMGSFVTVPLPAAARTGRVQAMVQDTRGALWISVQPQGIFRLKETTWQAGSGLEGLPAGPPNVMERDDSGALWLGYSSGTVARLIDGKVIVFDQEDSPDLGPVTMLRSAGVRMWIGGEKTLAVFDGKKMIEVEHSHCGPLEGIADIHETAEGGLLIYRPFGIAWFRNGVQEALTGQQPFCRLLARELDQTTGATLQLLGGAAPFAATADGRLWILAGGKVLWTTAERATHTPLPSIASINWIDVNGEKNKEQNPQFEPGTRSLLIGSYAWDLSSPSQVVYRYRLLGLDPQWRYTHIQSIAHLGNLGPGEYRFEVQAKSWGEYGKSATRTFSIKPYYYETLWFRLLVAVTIISLAGLAFVLQLRRAGARMRDRLEGQMLERERIARELHDTLLQGVQGLILRFQAVAARIPQNEQAAKLMEDVLDQADLVLAESRDRVAELREAPSHTSALPDAIAEMARSMAEGTKVRIATEVNGQIRALDGSVNSEVFLIAREAVSNALRHSGCSTLEIALGYERSWLHLRVRDDGSGIDENMIRNGRDGHYGLNGMRERAQRLRGTVQISGAPNQGTLIELRIPATLAYAKVSKRFAGAAS